MSVHAWAKPVPPPDISCAGEEGLELVADDLVEEGLLGLVTFVAVNGWVPVGTGF